MSGTVGRDRGRRLLAHGAAALVGALIVLLVVIGLQHGESLVENLPFLLLLVVMLGVGWLLASRLPRHPVGWILLAIPGLFTSTVPVQALGDALRDTAPAVSGWLYWYSGSGSVDSWSWLPPVWLLLSTLPLRFPDGRLPSARWRWFFRFSVGSLVVASALISVSPPYLVPGVPNPAFVPGVGDAAWASAVLVALLAPTFLGSILSLFVRYRSATATARAQLRWMLWAVAVAVMSLIAGWASNSERFQSWVLVAYCLIPVAIGVAVLRYRLYEIDRILSRTAAYAVVTVVVVVTYLAVVLLVSALVPHARTETPSVAIAVATLAAAAVFLPVLRWMRRRIDRVFNRTQYDAERVVVAFGERIRNGADPHTAGAELLSAVEASLDPAAVGLWVRS